MGDGPVLSTHVARDAPRTENQRRAAMLRASGWTYEAIGAELGVTRQRAHQLAHPEPPVPSLLRYLHLGRRAP